MGKKAIGKGDIVRIRHNESMHQFNENELVMVKETFPLWEEEPTHFKCCNRFDHWLVELTDVTLFERNPDPEDYY